MTNRQSSAELDARLDAALNGFALPERDWEADARRVEARLAAEPRGSVDAQLLVAPLPPEPNEPSTPSATATPLSNSGVRPHGLAELARRSVEKKQAADRELLQASMKLRAQLRDVRVPPSGDAPSRSPALAPLSPPRISNTSETAQPKRGTKLALALPVFACAAAVALWLHRAPTSTPLEVSNPPPVATTTVPTPSVAAASPAAPSDAPGVAQAKAAESPSGIDVQALATESDSNPAQSASAKAAPGATAPPSATGPRKAEKLARSADSTTSRSTNGHASGDPGATVTLPPDPSMRPADSTGAELAAKPSTGAVQAALGSVISGARRCVAGDDAPSSAVVVFGSDGRVQHVTVSGPAAGKSSAACIEAQLGRARVQPFAAPNFSVNATVRPD